MTDDGLLCYVLRLEGDTVRISMPEFTNLIGGLSFTEGPRWRDGRLYFSDFFTHPVLAVAMDGTAETVAHVPWQLSGLGFLPDGRMLIVSIATARCCGAKSTAHSLSMPISRVLVPWHLNDILVNHEGQAGNFGFDFMGGAPALTTVLICAVPDGTAKVVADRLGLRQRRGAHPGRPHANRGRINHEPS
jgi:hypothetical protein